MSGIVETLDDSKERILARRRQLGFKDRSMGQSRLYFLLVSSKRPMLKQTNK
jgi:hypothetical protein